ncbi:MAG: hypothetical protein Q9197_006941 [Variospora fuerteventurae]
MRLLHLLPFALLARATPEVFPRQEQPLENSTQTSPSVVSSAAAALVDQYFPSSVLPGLAVAIQSAAASSSISGNINSIVSSALTAATPPPFLTAVPSQYQSGLSSIQYSLSVIRNQESLSSVRSDASAAYQSRLSDIEQSLSAATAEPTRNGNVTVVSIITSMDSVFTTSLPATVLNGSTSVLSQSATMTMDGATASEGSSAGGGPDPTTASSDGLAAATKVPLAAAAAAGGVLGLVGMVAML